MFKTILVPLDGSQLAERALQPALALAEKASREVILLRVPVVESAVVPVAGGYGWLWPEQALDLSYKRAADYLHALQPGPAPPGVTLRTEIQEGDVAGAIVDTAAREKADLIVMSTHGYSGITRWVLGSVTEKVLRSASCPVLVVRSDQPIRKVLIPLDGSPLSERALAPGLEVAADLAAEVKLLRAVEFVPPDANYVEYLEHIERGLGRRLQDEFYKGAETYLADLATIYRRPGLNIRTLVVDGPPVKNILDFAERRGIDLIVMATHGRTGLRRWAYGSVTEKVMRSGCCSMLIVRPPAHELS